MEHPYLLVSGIGPIKGVHDVNPHIHSSDEVASPGSIPTKVNQSTVGSIKIVGHGDRWVGERMVVELLERWDDSLEDETSPCSTWFVSHSLVT
jgi:hypothetical protein